MDAIKKTWWLFAGIFAFWVAYPFIISSDLIKIWKPWMDWTLRGQLGDSFGALNTLFSGFALAGLAVNIHMQNEQLKKLEKKEQDNEDQLKAQVETLKDSALLSYYSDEIKRLSDSIDEVYAWKPSSPANEVERQDLLDIIHAQIRDLREKRKQLVSKLSGDVDADHSASDK